MSGGEIGGEMNEKLAVIIERIITQHWDLKACNCWVCEAGREAGCRPREEHLKWRGTFGYVDVAKNPGPR